MTDELTQFLKNNPGVEYVDVLLPDLCNVIRGKRLGADSIRKVYDGELQIPSSIELLDVTGGCTDAGGRGFSDGDPDVLILPVEGTLSRVPWGPPAQPRSWAAYTSWIIFHVVWIQDTFWLLL